MDDEAAQIMEDIAGELLEVASDLERRLPLYVPALWITRIRTAADILACLPEPENG